MGFCAHVTVVGKGIAAIDGPCAGYPAPRDGQHDLLRGLCGRARENPRWALPLAPGPGFGRFEVMVCAGPVVVSRLRPARGPPRCLLF